MKKDNERYDFSWEDLGDLDLGRPNLGSMTAVICYRLLEYTFKDVLSKEYGVEKTREIFIAAGRLAGEQFCINVLNVKLSFEAFLADLEQKLIDLKIGVLRIEKADMEAGTMTLTVSEDLDCSGLPLYGETVCDYDEGFLAGILFGYTGREFTVKEIDCWATGDRTCRFQVNVLERDDG
jgi:predicted hydrocarbon binding protein